MPGNYNPVTVQELARQWQVQVMEKMKRAGHPEPKRAGRIEKEDFIILEYIFLQK